MRLAAALLTTLGVLTLLCALTINGSDLGALLIVLIAAPLLTTGLIMVGLVFSSRRRWLVTIVVVFCILSSATALFTNYQVTRQRARWVVGSSVYKSRLLKQPLPPSALRHLDWDGWGFAGAGNTEVYLVYDPADLLAAETAIHRTGKFSGIPCPVWDVQRLEKNWYSVRFFTDQTWDKCDP